MDSETPLPTPVPVQPSSEVVSEVETPKSKKWLVVLIVVIISLFLLLTIGGVGVWAVAYEKIDIGNAAVKQGVSQFVLNLPFAPKTPKFVLTSAILAQKKISKHSFDLSIAADSDQLIKQFGLGNLDGEVKGNVDYSDPKNPRFSVNAALTKDFNADILKDDKLIYFKINKLPMLILTTYLGATDSGKINTILQNWVAYDPTPMDTAARAQLENNSKATEYTNEFVAQTANNFLDKKIVDEITMTETVDGGVPVYKLVFNPNDAMVDYLFDKFQGGKTKPTYPAGYTPPKISDSLKKLEISLLVQKQDFYIRQVSTSFVIQTPSSMALTSLGASSVSNMGSLTTGQPTQIPVVAVLKLANFGEPVTVTVPPKSVTPEDYMKLLMGQSTTLQAAQTQAKDTQQMQIMSSIRTALERCYGATNKYPIRLTDLKTCGGLTTVPNDFLTNQPYYYLASTDRTYYVLKGKLSSGKDYTVNSPQ